MNSMPRPSPGAMRRPLPAEERGEVENRGARSRKKELARMSAAGSIAGGLQLAFLAFDDVEMDAAAFGAAHGPVFGAGAAGDDAQDRQFGVAIGAIGFDGRRRR